MSAERPSSEPFSLVRLALDQSTDPAMFLLDAAGTIVTWGPAVAAMVGRPPDETVGQPFSALFSAEARAEGLPATLLEAARASGRVSLDRWPALHALGVRGSLSSVVHGPSTVGFAVRLTRGSEDEARLELSRRVAEFETLLDVIPVGIGIARDPKAEDIRVNQAFGAMLQISPRANASLSAPEAERPRHFTVQRDGQTVPADELPLQVAAREARAVRGVELDIVFESGEVVRLLEYAAPLFDEMGAVRGSVGAFIDITERRELETQRERLLASERAAREQAERTNRIKDEFLAGLSHELRTPLNAILGWAQILRRPDQSADHVSQGLEVIERNARLQTALIDDLLDMSRILAGQVRLDVQPLRLADAVQGAIESIRPSADAKGITLTTILDSHAGHVAGDTVRLQQVVWNVLSNAVKFTPQGGRVIVTLRRAASHVELSVADTGVGISAEFLPYVFDRFRQADGSTSRRFSGLGIGLSIVKHLVELHGGTIRAVSPGENLGATFVIALPLMHTRHDAPLLPDLLTEER